MKKLLLTLILPLALTIPNISKAASRYTSLYNYGYKAAVAVAIGDKTSGKAKLVVSFSNGVPSVFRLFIPPGAVSARISVFTQNDYGELVVRYQSPPVGTSYIENQGGYRLKSMIDKDVYLRERNIWIIDDRFQALGVAGSGWLYVKKLNRARLKTISATITIDVAKFLVWYNNPDTKWDRNGDPWSGDAHPTHVSNHPSTPTYPSTPVVHHPAPPAAPSDTHTPAPTPASSFDITRLFHHHDTQPVETVETYTGMVGESSIKVTLKQGDAVIAVDNKTYNFTYTDENGLVTIKDATSIPLLEFVRVGNTLILLPADRLVLQKEGE